MELLGTRAVEEAIPLRSRPTVLSSSSTDTWELIPAGRPQLFDAFRLQGMEAWGALLLSIHGKIDITDSMKVFISYGDAADQVTALRLQALGAANGLTVYVPPAHTRQGPQAFLDPTASQKLSDAEIVLGFIGNGLSAACRQELNAGLSLRKNMIVMAYPHLAQQLHPNFGQNLVVIDPANPDRSELGIVQHLKQIDAQQNAKKALLALGTLVLGLLILAPAEKT